MHLQVLRVLPVHLIQVSEFNTLEEVNYIIENVTQIVSNLRKMSPLWEKITKGEKGV